MEVRYPLNVLYQNNIINIKGNITGLDNRGVSVMNIMISIQQELMFISKQFTLKQCGDVWRTHVKFDSG